MTRGQFPVSACANQATGFPVNGSLTPNGLLQTINGLLETAPSTITCCIVPFGLVFFIIFLPDGKFDNSMGVRKRTD